MDVEVDVDVDIEENSAAVTAEPNPNVAGAQTAGYHKVQKGDTLFSIAVKYFNSRDGEALIQQANGKTDKTVMVGETLIIPERR